MDSLLSRRTSPGWQAALHAATVPVLLAEVIWEFEPEAFVAIWLLGFFFFLILSLKGLRPEWQSWL